jgi:hypothetical protein
MPADLVRRCRDARTAGKDFPTIWHTVLRGHPLVAGVPMQTVGPAGAQLEIALTTGHHLVYDSAGNDYALRP